MIKDRRHWEWRIGRWRFERWCAGQPCWMHADARHPVRLFRIAR